MRKRIFLSCLSALFLGLQAQAQGLSDFNLTNNASPTQTATRAGARTVLAPFYHGVASGDPTDNSVMIWTRVTTDSTTANVKWRVCTDTTMLNPIATGIVSTDASKDFTVKVDVTGLTPNTYYYYEFEAFGAYSLRGRTKTLPTGNNVDSLRFGVVSCSNFGHGFFNGYEDLTRRNDVDLIIHLGDYIYEYASGEFGNERTLLPTSEILSLSDYRTRYSHYRLDEDLMRLHQQYAFINIWDDHETANDSWYGGAGNHSASEGSWFDRKDAAKQAYFEWLPIRQIDPNTYKIYRDFQFGDLMNLYMLDTRLEGRDEQNGIDYSATRTLLGAPQFEWLTNNLKTKPTHWNVLGQQVMMAPLLIPQATWPITYGPFQEDQWDGYPVERQKLYDTLATHNINNFVVLTGDIHTAWANDLSKPGYNSSTGAGSAGVEFVVSSITSLNSPLPVPSSIISNFNPHIKYSELHYHGYLILDVNRQRVQSDWYNLSTVTSKNYGVSLGASFECRHGETFLRRASSVSAMDANRYQLQAPLEPRVHNGEETSVGEVNEMESVLLGAYPNPVTSELTLQYTLHKDNNVHIQLVDIAGKILYNENINMQAAGLHRQAINVETLAAGSYALVLKIGEKTQQRIIVKK